MATRKDSKIPGSIFGRVEFYNKLYTYITSQMERASEEEQGFWPLKPQLPSGEPVSNLDVRLQTGVNAPTPQSVSQQIISTWLYGYGYQWTNNFGNGTRDGAIHEPFIAGANARTFPLVAETGFFLANLSGNFDLSLNPELGNPFPGSGKVMSFLESVFYYTPSGVRSAERVKALQKADGLLEKYTRQFLIPLFLTNASAIPDNDLVAMGLRPRQRTRRSPLPPPQIAPTLDVLTGQNHNIKVTVTELNEGGATRLMVSTLGIKGCRIDWRFKDEREDDAEDSGADWTSIHCTRFKEWIKFDESDAGRFIELRAAFLNPRLQPGPVSKIVTAVIT